MKKLLSFSILYILFFSLSLNAQVGINTINPLSMLDINGSLSVKTIGIDTPLLGGANSASAPLIDDGIYISITPSGGNNDFKLPYPTVVPGRVYIIRNVSTTNTAYLLINGTPGTDTGRFFAKDSANPTPSTGIPVIVMPPNSSFKTLILISDGKNWTYLF